MKYAMELIKKKKYDANTPVTKVIEDGESLEFKSLFESWKMSEAEKVTNTRLFRVSRNGTFKQVAQFELQDLEEDNVMILGMNQNCF